MTTKLQQLRDEALTYLVLWAASKEYSPDIEAALKHWAETFEIPEAELMTRIMAASSGKLTRPDPNAPATAQDTEAAAGQEAAAVTAAAEAAPLENSSPPAAEEQPQQQQQ